MGVRSGTQADEDELDWDISIGINLRGPLCAGLASSPVVATRQHLLPVTMNGVAERIYLAEAISGRVL